MSDEHTTLTKDLRKAYQKAWDNLANFWQQLSDDGSYKYDQEIANKLEPILFAVASKLSDQDFKIGRGIIYINSFHTNQRLRFPFFGSVKTNGSDSKTISKQW